MEDVRKYLNSDESSEESDSEDVKYATLRNVSDITTKKCGEDRLPTRRPNPNVYNRNALLARENRRKKKAYLETIEKELDEVRKSNRLIIKAFKKQSKAMRQLQQEKQYYKNILANQPEISHLVRAINAHLPLQQPNSSPTLNQVSLSPNGTEGSFSSRYSCSSFDADALSINLDKSDNGSVKATTLNCSGQTLSTNNFFDFDFSVDVDPVSNGLDDTWKELIEDGLCLGGDIQQTSVYCDNLSNNVNDEHSYVNLCKKTDSKATLNDTGICLHLTGHKVSLEFCPSCNWNASHTPATNLSNYDI